MNQGKLKATGETALRLWELHASSMTVDLASSRMSCGHQPYAHLTISMQPYLVLIQRFSAGGKKYSAGSVQLPTAFCGLQRLMSSTFCLYEPR
jgi:hypothetical protein